MPSKSLERKREEISMDVPAFFFLLLFFFSTRNGEKGTEDYREIFYKEVELERTPCLVVIL